MEDLAMSRRLNLTLPAIALVKAPLAAARLKVGPWSTWVVYPRLQQSAVHLLHAGRLPSVTELVLLMFLSQVLELVDHLVSLPGALEGVINNYW
jgi:hypothetical protein